MPSAFIRRRIREMLCSRVDGAMLIAAGTIDLHLEPKRGYLAKCREGQSVEHGPRLRPASSQRRINFLPSVLASDVGVINRIPQK
jgi:hypothetical protein